jgi:hypothetical protein
MAATSEVIKIKFGDQDGNKNAEMSATAFFACL